jgi:hypothetical protein
MNENNEIEIEKLKLEIININILLIHWDVEYMS